MKNLDSDFNFEVISEQYDNSPFAEASSLAYPKEIESPLKITELKSDLNTETRSEFNSEINSELRPDQSNFAVKSLPNFELVDTEAQKSLELSGGASTSTTFTTTTWGDVAGSLPLTDPTKGVFLSIDGKTNPERGNSIGLSLNIKADDLFHFIFSDTRKSNDAIPLDAEPKPSPLALKLASNSHAVARDRNTIERCWTGVADALDAVSRRKTWGVPAFESSSQYLDSDSRFKRLNISDSSWLPFEKMLPGDVVALPWTRYGEQLRGGRKDGHVIVYLGKGALIDSQKREWSVHRSGRPTFVPEEDFDQYPKLSGFSARPVEASDHLAYIRKKTGYYDYARTRIWRAR